MVHKPKIEDEETNHGPQTSTHRAKPSKTGGDLRDSVVYTVPAPLVAPVHLLMLKLR